MGFHLESLWGATLMPHRACAMDWDKTISRLWTKVHEIFGHRRRPFVLSNAFARLSTSRFVQQKFAIKSRSRRKTEQIYKFFGPNFFREGRPQYFYYRLLARPIVHVHRLAKFGWVSFADLRLRSLEMKWNADFTKGSWKLTFNIWSRLCTKFHVVLRWCSRPLVVVNAHARLSISRFVRKV